MSGKILPNSGNSVQPSIGIWLRSRSCGCLVTLFCYQLIAKPGNKTAAVLWPDPLIWNQDELSWTWWTVQNSRQLFTQFTRFSKANPDFIYPLKPEQNCHCYWKSFICQAWWTWWTVVYCLLNEQYTTFHPVHQAWQIKDFQQFEERNQYHIQVLNKNCVMYISTYHTVFLSCQVCFDSPISQWCMGNPDPEPSFNTARSHSIHPTPVYS